MIRKVSHVTILVKDQEEALDFYTEKLGFEKREDKMINRGLRWLVVAPKGQNDFGLVLFRADTPDKQKAIGQQVGGHILLVVRTENCKKTYEFLKGKGVECIGTPKENPWGTEVVFKDLYGNHFNLIQPQGWEKSNE